MMRGPSYTGWVLGGRYAVAELLGQGGWGAVYAALQTDLGRRVALKILHADVAHSSDAMSRFEREAKAAAALGHPNIVQVTDFQANPGEPPFLVMEMLTGATLGALLKRQAFLPPQRVATIGYQVLSALDVAHRAGIVHRDVKPDNVFVVSMPGIDDFVKLLDFGIAKLSTANHAQLTGDGQVLGSPAFMAPEQVRGLPLDPRTDIYAVGATMYFALSGRRPIVAENVAALLTAIIEQRPPPLASVAHNVDPRLVAIVERALHKDPLGRFASAAEMRVALEPLIGPGSVIGITPATPVPHLGLVGRADTAATIGTDGAMLPSALLASYTTASKTAATTFSSPPATMSRAAPSMGTRGLVPSSHAPPSHAPPAQLPPLAANVQHAPHMPAATGAARAPQARTSVALLASLALVVVGVLAVFIALTHSFLTKEPGAPVGSSEPLSVSSAAATAVVTTTPTSTPTSTNGQNASAMNGTPRTRPGPSPLPVVPMVDGGRATALDAGGAAALDAGGGAGVDAGAKPARRYGGTRPVVSGGSFEKYDIAKAKEAVNRVTPQLTACYAAVEFEPPDHGVTTWKLTIDPAGNVTSARRATQYEPHAKLDPCVIAALRMSKWQATPAGGSPQINLVAR